jgi:D-beta-D-heptose 7-phosphate kinase/D-beta-D-heptose 1-phosphate adenosyltransferase
LDAIGWIHDLGTISDCIAAWRKEGLAIGFTNRHSSSRARSTAVRGAFLLRPARQRPQKRHLGQAPQGAGTPDPARSGAFNRAGRVAFVDAVILFAEDTPLDMIASIKPDVLVKGADYCMDQVVATCRTRDLL